MLPVTFGIHKTFLVASTLAARLGPKPVYRNAKCRGGAESSAQAKPSADVPWPWRSPCETPEEQQDSSPRQAKCPYAKLPKASNGSKLRAQGMQNTSQQKCFPLPLESIKHVLWPAPSLRGWVRHQYTATPTAVEEVMRSFRKPRTAARFVPKACKTQARKKASQKRCVRNPSTWCRNCWQRIRKGQTPLQAELGQAKNDAFATLPHGAETAASKP